MASVKPFKAATLEMIANILGDTGEGLTGSQIHHALLSCSIDDVDPTNTKRYRLYNAFVEFQNKNHCANNIANFVKFVMDPSRYVEQEELFHQRLTKVNQQLAFEGIELTEEGKLTWLNEKASKISDVQIRVESLKSKLEQRNAHQKIFACCKAELLQNNYFHAVFESSKSLVKRIQTLSACEFDGQNLMEKVLKDNENILIINNYQSRQEKDEHSGFRSMLIGIVSMFRNPEAHQLKIEWPVSEQDALEILSIISYCHRRLDNAQRIR